MSTKKMNERSFVGTIGKKIQKSFKSFRLWL